MQHLVCATFNLECFLTAKLDHDDFAPYTLQVYPVSPVAGPGAARSVWELSPDPDMVGHLPNNPISGHQNHGSGKDTRQRSRPDDNIYTDEATTGQSPTDETKRIFELLRAG